MDSNHQHEDKNDVKKDDNLLQGEKAAEEERAFVSEQADSKRWSVIGETRRLPSPQPRNNGTAESQAEERGYRDMTMCKAAQKA